MNDNNLIQDIEHVDVTEMELEPVTYNFTRSMQIFEAAFRAAYTNRAEFYEKSACIALENLATGLELHPDSVMLFDSEDAITNLCQVVQENPAIIATLASDGLMNIFGKYMSRSDINKPNGDFNPRSIINCAKEDFGLDLLGKVNIPFVSEDLILSFLDKL